MGAEAAVRQQRRVEYDGIGPLGAAVARLGLEPSDTVVVVGSADSFDEDDTNRLDRLLQRGLADICKRQRMTVVYGGTKSGVMQVLGKAMAEFAPELALVGVAPKGLVAFDGATIPPGGAEADPHHTHFLLAPEGPWASEATVLVGLAERLAEGNRVAMVVIGGGEGTRTETSLACERDWAILAIDGVDGTSSNLAARATEFKRGRTKWQGDINDPVDRSISVEAISPVRIDDLHAFRRALGWRFSAEDLLKEAWLRYSQIDAAASTAKPIFSRWKRLLLALGVLTTALSIVAGRLEDGIGRTTTSVLLVLLTSISGAIVAFIARRRRDARWLSLRAAAQAVAREIYRYRTRAGPYLRVAEGEEERLSLASALASIDGRLSGETALVARPQGFSTWPPTISDEAIDGADELLGRLDGHAYDALRAENQIRYFTRAYERLSQRIDTILMIVYGAGVVATVLGAMSSTAPIFGSFVAFVVAFAAAFVAWLDSEQLEQQSSQMALTAAGIRAARERWLARALTTDPAEASQLSARFATDVEESLEAESIQWERALRQAHQSFQAGLRSGA